jgi:hypothetical protein
VVGVKRAVQVATSADHTLVLCAATLPSLPYADKVALYSSSGASILCPEGAGEELQEEELIEISCTSSVSAPHKNQLIGLCDDKESRAHSEVLTLKQYCELEVARSVDITNVAQVLEYANILGALALAQYCSTFILMNLDSVLTQGRMNDLDILISDILETATSNFSRPPALPRAISATGSNRGGKSRSNSAVRLSDLT